MKIICIIISEACSLVLSSSRNIKEPASHHNSVVLWISQTEGSWLHYTRAALLTGGGGGEEEWKPTAEEKRIERKGRNRIRSNKGESSGPSNGKQRGKQGALLRRRGNGKGEAVAAEQAHYFQLSFALDIVLGMWFGNVTNDVVDICRRR